MSTAVLLPAVLARVHNLLSEHLTVENEFRNTVSGISNELKIIQGLLLNRAEQEWEFSQEVLRLAHDIEDAVEAVVLGESHDHDINNICKRIDELRVSLEATLTQLDTSSSNDALNHLPRTEFVGLDKETKQLLSRLRAGSYSNWDEASYIISIVGKPGTGKTSLALKVFSAMRNLPDYNRLCLVRVTHNFRMEDVMVQFSDKSDEIIEHLQNMSISELGEKLGVILEERRYLIILDDVWSTDVYDKLRALLPNKFGSSIIITTSDERVASHILGDVIRLGPLQDDATIELFQQVSAQALRDLHKNELLGSIVSSILNLCQGVPSLIIKVAQSFNGHPVQNWDKMLNDMLTQDSVEARSLQDTIGLSYKYLDPLIKLCFLYLGQFPPNQRISVEKLYLMWSAEGLVSTRDEAESSLKRLIDVNLLIAKPEDESVTRKLLSCQLHDMTRRLSFFKGKTEAFFAIVDCKPGSGRTSMVDRIVVHLDSRLKRDGGISSIIHNVNHIRSLLFFGGEKLSLLSQWPRKFAGQLEHFKWTRVLEFDDIDFRDNNFPMSIDKLFYLRYLGIGRCYLEEFPLSCSRFPYMETLDLRVRTKLIIPNVLFNMSKLKHLYFPAEFESKPGEKLQLDGLTTLETLENFHSGVCDVGSLLQFEHLQILKVIALGENNDLKNLISNMDVISISHLPKKSSLDLKKFDCYSVERKETFKNLLECHGIHSLYLEGYIKRMPKDLKIVAQNFTEMVLDRTEFHEDPMPILGRFENLQSLVLRNHAIKVDAISCTGSSFSNLERYEMTNLTSLKHWMLDLGESMPNLSVLTIKQCRNLLELPEDMMESPTLSKLIFGSMSQGFVESVRVMINEQLRNGNEELCRSIFYEDMPLYVP